MVIDNKIGFIPIPKNASWSVEDTCVKYKLDLKYPDLLWENSIRMGIKNPSKHIHSTISDLSNKFGNNIEYVAIIRNSTDRFISAWKFFISSIEFELNNKSLSDKIKKLDNDFLMNFIKENYSQFTYCYDSPENNINLLIKLLDKMGIISNLYIDSKFKSKFSTHILSFISQYQWILHNQITVKQFDFEKLNEFEDYISNKLNVDFKLLHQNKTKLDYCAVEKTDELVLFVDRYIDGMYKKNKSII